MPEKDKGSDMDQDENVVYPEVPLLITEHQAEEELETGRVYRLNDRFFKFLFGGEDRKHLFLDLVNALVLPDGSTGFTENNFLLLSLIFCILNKNNLISI